MTVYLDGEELEGVPVELELRADKPHVLFFRAEGYRPERVVLFSRLQNGEPHLEPAQVSLRLVPTVAGSRSLEIEREER